MNNEKKNVLIAEDDEDIMFVLEEGLSNYNIACAHNGAEALKKISELKPDLIIMDIMMPELNGAVLNRKLKQDNELKDIPVIIITGRPQMKGLFSDKGDNRVSGFLEKPFALDVLRKEIERHI